MKASTFPFLFVTFCVIIPIYYIQQTYPVNSLSLTITPLTYFKITHFTLKTFMSSSHGNFLVQFTFKVLSEYIFWYLILYTLMSRRSFFNNLQIIGQSRYFISQNQIQMFIFMICSWHPIGKLWKCTCWELRGA